MRKALLACLTGLLLTAGSCVPFGIALWRDLGATARWTGALDDSGRIEARVDGLAPGGHADLHVELALETDSVQEDADDAGQPRYRGRFAVPVDYAVADGAGARIAGAREDVRWDGDGTTRDAAFDARGGTVTVSRALARFPVPADGRVAVSLVLAPDATYGAQVRTATARVRDGVPDYTLAGAVWAVAVVVGGTLLVAGMVALIGLAPSPAVGAPPGPPDDARVRMIVTTCHLGGLLGYLVPFGSVLVPLAIWLAERGSDPRIDAAGREVLDFQISVFIYGVIALVLVLVLIGLPLLVALACAHVVLTVMGATRAWSGRPWRYPLTLRFLR